MLSLSLPILLTVGLLSFAGLYTGKLMRFVRLPSIIGFMLVGVLLGPSLLNLLDEDTSAGLGFITDIALGFVAVSIGLELSFSSLKKQGRGIPLIIFSESFIAAAVVFGGIYLLTGNLPLALIFGAIAPASAPAGTVAVIQEYRAKGSLTKALYAVVGFDDGLGIIIFGFASAFAKSILQTEAGGEAGSLMQQIGRPLLEVLLSIGIGTAAGSLFSLLSLRLKSSRDVFILIFSLVLIVAGLSQILHVSLILTNMVLGIFIVNVQKERIIEQLRGEIQSVLPLLFILFFVLAGANLHLAALPSLGIIGAVYLGCRAFGLMGGAALGAAVSRADSKIRKYLGMGILSQAGVAIGLALIVKSEFTALGTAGAYIGASVITTVTATSIIFEIIGPILTKIGLTKAGEIKKGGSPA